MLTFVLAATLPLGGRAAAAIDVTNTPAITQLAGWASVLEDPTGRLDLPAVLELPDSYWQASRDGLLRLGHSRSAWWLRLILTNSGPLPRRLILEVGQPGQDFLDFYLVQDHETLRTVETGDLRPFASRPLTHSNFALPLELPPGMTEQVYLRIQSHSGSYEPLPLRLLDPEAFTKSHLETNLWLGAYYGALLSLALLHLLLYFPTQDRLFLLYSACLLLFTVEHFGLNGFGYQHLWPESPWLNRQLDITLPSLIHAGFTTLVVLFLQTREKVPYLHRTLLVLTALLGLPTAVALADSAGIAGPTVWAMLLFRALSLLLIFMYLLTSVVIRMHDYAPGRFFVAAWASVLVGTLFGFLVRILPAVPDNGFTENAFTLASIPGLLFLALALGDRWNRHRDEQLKEGRRLLGMQRAHTAQLESQIQDRTLELRKAMLRIKSLARTDELTQLYNLRAFNEYFQREFARSRRDRSLLAFALLDVDQFRRYNDHYGHVAGDQVLRQVAGVLRRWLRRPGDFAFRLGGTEFGILVSDPISREQSVHLMENIRKSLLELSVPHIGNDQGIVTCSIGLAFNLDIPDPSPQTLYRYTEEGLARAKDNGRNRLEIAGESAFSPPRRAAANASTEAPATDIATPDPVDKG